MKKILKQNMKIKKKFSFKKKNKSKHKSKKILKQKGGIVDNYILNKNEIPKDRFKIEFREFRKIADKTLSIIDKKLNNRYIFDKKQIGDNVDKLYNVLVDKDSTSYYAFYKDGTQILNENEDSEYIKEALGVIENG